MESDILKILRSIAAGNTHAALYGWVNPDALFVEKVLQEFHAEARSPRRLVVRYALAASILLNVVLTVILVIIAMRFVG